jgi:hypothetical protein
MRAFDLIQEVVDDFGYDSSDSGVQETFRKYLNRSLKDIVSRSRSIQRELFISATKDEYRYALPDDFAAVQVCRWQDDPPLRKTNLRDVFNRRYSQKTGSDPTRYDVWGNSHIDRISGTATGGNSTELDDTTVDFTALPNPQAQPRIRDFIFNLTDGSESEISIVAATKLTLLNPLLGGVDNTFAVGDSYKVTSRSGPLKTLYLWPAPDADDAVGDQSIGVLYQAQHRILTQADLTNGNDELELDIELQSALILRMEYWAHGPGTPERRQALIDYNTEYTMNIPNVRRRVEDTISMWSTSDTIRQNLVTGTASPAGHPYNTITI